MTEPTKFLLSEEDLQRWAAEHAKGSGFLLDVLSAEILRLRAELAKASAEAAKPAPFSQCNDGWGYAISSIVWNDMDCPSRISVTRTDNNGRTQVLDFVEPNRFLSSKKPKDAPPADVLGESLRGRLCAALLDERVPASIYGAVHELAQVVERIARAQRGGK